MRLWSIHPKHLDSKGLIALWREALLAKAVLKGQTKGYLNHPQLRRFRESNDPVNCINHYLEHVYKESLKRGYRFNKDKIDPISLPNKIAVTDKQMHYERNHLLNKLKTRDIAAYFSLSSQKDIDSHPLFFVTQGEIEDWEKRF